MSVLACLGRLEHTTLLNGRWDLPAPREKFMGYRFDPGAVLYDKHGGEPLARLRHHVEDDDGYVLAVFDPYGRVSADRIEALAERSKSLSIEFDADRSEVRQNVTIQGGSCLLHFGAVILGAAFAPDPARGDATMVRARDVAPTPHAQARSRSATRALPGDLPRDRWPEAVERRYFTPTGQPRTCYGPPGRVISGVTPGAARY